MFNFCDSSRDELHIFNDDHVNNVAIGFKSDAYVFNPVRAASNGIEPPPQKQSPTIALCPYLRIESWDTNPCKEFAEVPRW